MPLSITKKLNDFKKTNKINFISYIFKYSLRICLFLTKKTPRKLIKAFGVLYYC